MARIRTIKPDAFKSESLADVSFFARWLFAGLWTYCDDYGKGRGDARLIKAELFPLDDIVDVSSVENGIDELVRIGSVCRYEVDGKWFLHCPNWGHQKVSHPTKTGIPFCPKHHPETDPRGVLVSPPENFGGPPEPLVSPPESLRPYREGKGREQGGEATPVTPPRRPPEKCRKHLTDPDPPNCGQCATARRAAEQWQAPTLSAKSYPCPEHPDQRAGLCPKCAAEGSPDGVADLRAALRPRSVS